MGHADPMRFHGMTLSVIIISNITIVVVADFLLAASLTVRHGLPDHRHLRLLLWLLLLLLLLPQLGGERRGLGRRWGVCGSAAGKGRLEGRREERRGVPGGLGTARLSGREHGPGGGSGANLRPGRQILNHCATRKVQFSLMN